MGHFNYRGLPRTPEEWTALAQIASGHDDVSKEELRGLFMLGLVDRQLGRVCLSDHGRATLGLAEAKAGASIGRFRPVQRYDEASRC